MPDPHYYLDTNGLWKYYRESKGSLNIQRLVSRVAPPVFVSPLTQLEFFHVLAKYYRSKLLKRKEFNGLIENVRRDISFIGGNPTRPFVSVPLPVNLFRQAEIILLNHVQFDIGSMDALHVAVVKELQKTYPDVVMVTSDSSLQNVCTKSSIGFYDPEINL